MVCVSTLTGVQLIDTRTLEVLRTIKLEGQMKGAVEMDEATGTACFGASHSGAVDTWTRVPMGR